MLLIFCFCWLLITLSFVKVMIQMKARKLIGLEALLDYKDPSANPIHDPKKGNSVGKGGNNPWATQDSFYVQLLSNCRVQYCSWVLLDIIYSCEECVTLLAMQWVLRLLLLNSWTSWKWIINLTKEALFKSTFEIWKIFIS